MSRPLGRTDDPEFYLTLRKAPLVVASYRTGPLGETTEKGLSVDDLSDRPHAATTRRSGNWTKSAIFGWGLQRDSRDVGALDSAPSPWIVPISGRVLVAQRPARVRIPEGICPSGAAFVVEG